MRWLRFLIDRIAARREWHHPIDSTDCPDDCARCGVIEKRNERLAKFRIARRLAKARLV